jgi:P-type Ca2+ transporter type 2B
MCVYERKVEHDLIESGKNKEYYKSGARTESMTNKDMQSLAAAVAASAAAASAATSKRSIVNLGTSRSGHMEASPNFSVTQEELRALMELKLLEFKDKLNSAHDGVLGLANKLNTNIQNGISGTKEDLTKRAKVFGRNEIPPKPPKSIFKLAFEALQDPTLIMLMICAIVSVALSFYHPGGKISDEEYLTDNEEQTNLEWVEGSAIMLAVIVVVFVTAFNDWRKERQFRGLQDRIARDQLASVVRNGQIVQVNIKELVVGDICCIKYGDLIPADGIVTQASDLRIDESSLTGETDLIKKNETDSLTILSGTQVMEGSGHFMVTAVGLNSQTGIIMTLLDATGEEKSEGEQSDGEEENDKDKKKAKAKLKKNAKKGKRIFILNFSTTKNFPKDFSKSLPLI